MALDLDQGKSRMDCSRCGVSKPDDQFSRFMRFGKTYSRKQCRDCRREIKRAPSAASARRRYPDMKLRKDLHRKELRDQKIAIVNKLKDVPCADCGRKWPAVAMDFDHVRGEKITDIGRMVQSAYSVETLLAEIAKCEVVCACCHRIRTFGSNLSE
jgi:hypothetical protein